MATFDSKRQRADNETPLSATRLLKLLGERLHDLEQENAGLKSEVESLRAENSRLSQRLEGVNGVSDPITGSAGRTYTVGELMASGYSRDQARAYLKEQKAEPKRDEAESAVEMPRIVGPTEFELLIPAEFTGAVIGKQGARASHMRKLSGARIQITDPRPGERTGGGRPSGPRVAYITGSPEAVAGARAMLKAAMSDARGADDSGVETWTEKVLARAVADFVREEEEEKAQQALYHHHQPYPPQHTAPQHATQYQQPQWGDGQPGQQAAPPQYHANPHVPHYHASQQHPHQQPQPQQPYSLGGGAPPWSATSPPGAMWVQPTGGQPMAGHLARYPPTPAP